MEVVTCLGIPLGFIGALARSFRTRAPARQTTEPWEAAAASLAVSLEVPERAEVARRKDPGVGWMAVMPRSLTGAHRGLNFEVREEERDPGANRWGIVTLVEVTGPHLSRHFTLRCRGAAPGPSATGSHPVATGDAVFDAAMEVKAAPGHQATAIALLSGANRRLLSGFLVPGEGQLALADGALVLELRGSTVELAPVIAGTVVRCLELGRGLSLEPEGLVSALAANARFDRHAEVRLRNLETLGAVCRGTPTARGAGAAALSDADERVRRLGAALTQGPSLYATAS